MQISKSHIILFIQPHATSIDKQVEKNRPDVLLVTERGIGHGRRRALGRSALNDIHRSIVRGRHKNAAERTLQWKVIGVVVADIDTAITAVVCIST